MVRADDGMDKASDAVQALQPFELALAGPCLIAASAAGSATSANSVSRSGSQFTRLV